MATTLNWTIILLQIMISQKKEKKIALLFWFKFLYDYYGLQQHII